MTLGAPSSLIRFYVTASYYSIGGIDIGPTRPLVMSAQTSTTSQPFTTIAASVATREAPSSQAVSGDRAKAVHDKTTHHKQSHRKQARLNRKAERDLAKAARVTIAGTTPKAIGSLFDGDRPIVSVAELLADQFVSGTFEK